MTDKKPRILAIDDTPANLWTLGAALAMDFDLQIATSGAMGLALAMESLPDLILLDVMMPDMDGFETCRRLKAESMLTNVPVVFITALTEIGSEIKGLALGAADYLSKPINVEIARQRIFNLLDRERLRKEVEVQRDLLKVQITERKRAEIELQESEERFRNFFEKNSSVMLLVDPASGKVIDANQAAATYYGYPRTMLAGMPVSNLNTMPPECIAEARQRALREDCNCFNFIHRLASGQVRDVEVHSTPIESGGRPLLFSIVHDVTERKQSEEQLRISDLALQAISQGVLITDSDGCILSANDAVSSITGYSKVEIIGRTCSLFQGPLTDPGTLESLRLAQENATGFSGDILNYRKDGTTFWNELSISPMCNESGQLTHFIGIIRDINERKQAEEKLHLAASVFSHSREGIMITTAEGTIIEVNSAFTRITGYSREEVIGQNPRLLSSGRHESDFYAAMWRGLIEKGHWYGEVWNRRKNGEVYPEMQTISTVYDALGKVRQYVALFSDITLAKEHERQLEHIAHYDALTGLPNRMLLADRLHQAIAQSQRRGRQLAVAYLDLDGFKAINDNHGHEAGDQLLIAVAARMKQVLREGDTLARLGGDEFVAVLLDLTDVGASVPMLTRLLAAAAKPLRVGDLLLQVSASVGVTFYPQEDDIDADQLLRQADHAMYQAKLAGKNRYHIFDAKQDRSIRSHHEDLERIRRALTDHEFVLYYQPKVNMRTGMLIGAEALIRWQHPKNGLLLPADFLPMIEDHSLAIEVGEWVIETAVIQMQLWQAIGLDIPVSVNVGARQLQQVGFVEHLRALLVAHPDIRPGDLSLEILETSALEDMAKVSAVIEACRQIGMLFELDDFGTGYSSLTYLKHLLVSQLKIDQSFVHDMLEDPDNLAILEGVIGLAAAFQRGVIAEGVETVEHGKMLLKLGCEVAQGYGIAYPMPANELPAWSVNWRPDPAWVNLHCVSRNDLPVLYAGVEHRAWIGAISSYLKGEREVPPTLDQRKCRFGIWLDTAGKTRYGTRPVFQTIEALHLEAHALAAELCALKVKGQILEAVARLGELHRLRDALLEQLQALI